MKHTKYAVLMMVFTLIISLIATISVFADATKQIKEGIFTYIVEDDAATITNIDDAETVVVIPEELDGVPVTALSGGACGGSIKIQEVVIPDTVTSIGAMCFSYCTELTKVILPQNLSVIESGVFNHCTKLRSIDIPQSVKTIEKDAFYRCDELWTITLPNGLKSIGENAFAACPNLSAATIPASVSFIGENAFQKADGFRIYAKPNTLGNSYAEKNEITFEELITVTVNGTDILFDQPPITDQENYRTLVPMRAVVDALDAKVSWDNQLNTAGIELNQTRILIRIGESFMMVNGEAYPLSSPAIEFNNRTLLPIRSIIEAMSGTVQWDEDTKHIDIKVVLNH